MNTPTQEQIDKLPKWAQEHIAFLKRRLVEATNDIKRFVDHQMPSEVYYDEGFTERKRIYVQSDRLTFTHAGVTLDVAIYHPNHIELRWDGIGRGLTDVALIPDCFQQARLVAKDKMRS